MKRQTKLIGVIGGVALFAAALALSLRLKENQTTVDYMLGKPLSGFLEVDLPTTHPLIQGLQGAKDQNSFVILHLPSADPQLQEMDRRVLGCLKEKLPARIVGCRDVSLAISHHLKVLYERHLLIPQADLIVLLGAYDLPETLVVNPKGRLVFRWRGPLPPVFCEQDSLALPLESTEVDLE